MEIRSLGCWILGRGEGEKMMVVNGDNGRMGGGVFILIMYGGCW